VAECAVVARLVAATCPKCGAGVRIDPDNEYVTCSYCGVSSFIQTRRRQPTEQVIRTHQPVIHLENTARRISGCVSALISVGVLGGIGIALATAFAANLPGLAQQFLGGDAGSPIPIQLPGLPSAFTPPAPAPEENLFATPALVKTKLEERLGKPVMVKDLVLYPTYARAVAQDPKAKHHLDSYFYRYGNLQDPEPQRLVGSGKRNVDKLVFSLDEVDFTKIPQLLASASADLAIEQGAVTHVIIERGGFGTKAPVVRVYVNGPRDGGYVEYDLRGRRTRVAK
jgi:DNA-directed RNA polymerase subunit RPC12/RpoP